MSTSPLSPSQSNPAPVRTFSGRPRPAVLVHNRAAVHAFVRDGSSVAGVALAVLHTLASLIRADAGYTCRINNRQWQRYLPYSLAAITSAVKELISLGYLRRVKLDRVDELWHPGYEYFLNVPLLQRLAEERRAAWKKADEQEIERFTK